MSLDKPQSGLVHGYRLKNLVDVWRQRAKDLKEELYEDGDYMTCANELENILRFPDAVATQEQPSTVGEK